MAAAVLCHDGFSSDSDASSEAKPAVAPGTNKRFKALEARRPRKRLTPGVSVIERAVPSGTSRASVADTGGASAWESTQARSKRIRSQGSVARKVSLDETRPLPSSFAEDFFRSQTGAAGCLRLALAAKAHLKDKVCPLLVPQQADRSTFPEWLQLLQTGFSLLFHGVGSKRRILDAFADESLEPWGHVVRCYCYHAKFSLVKLLQEVLETYFPDANHKGGNSAESLACTVKRMAASREEPVLFVVHNLELLSAAHQRILASLASSRNLHLAASVDSVWEALGRDAASHKEFGFCRVEAHTFEGYEVESKARFPAGLPAWTGLGDRHRSTPSASLTVVLRSLTNNHRELVEAIAERQLEEGGGRRAGISLKALLEVATERLICNTLPKLRVLLKELQDHEVVVQKVAAEGVTHFHLPYDTRILERLKFGESLSDSSGEEDDAASHEENVTAA